MSFSIKAKKREGCVAEKIRGQGMIPGVVYGGDREETCSFAIGYNEFEKLYNGAGESTLIDFLIDGEKEPVKVVVKDVQYDPVKGRIIHVDLKQIKMSEKMQASVELNFIGESPAVKELGGTLMKGVDSVDVKCLPKDLLGHIDVDLSVIKTFEDSITVADLSVPPEVAILGDLSILVAKVTPPLSDEQLKAMEETKPEDISAVAVEGDKKSGAVDESENSEEKSE